MKSKTRQTARFSPFHLYLTFAFIYSVSEYIEGRSPLALLYSLLIVTAIYALPVYLKLKGSRYIWAYMFSAFMLYWAFTRYIDDIITSTVDAVSTILVLTLLICVYACTVVFEWFERREGRNKS